MTLFEFVITFLSIGFFTIGGGLVSIPLLYNAFVMRGILSSTDFFQFVSIAESSPGPIAINLATYLGFTQFGVVGASLATLMFIVPSFLLLEWFYPWYLKHQTMPFLMAFIQTMKISVLALIGITLMRVLEHIAFQHMDAPIVPGLIFITLILVFYFNQKRPFLIIGMGAFLGVLLLA
jgi:chromate transporter